MKHAKPGTLQIMALNLTAIGAVLLLASSGATAQSLGDYARTVRNNKTETSAPSRHYDNDNLPSNEGLSVVGPPPSTSTDAAANAKPSSDAASAAADKRRAADDWKNKLDQQKEKIDALSHELDLDQREYRLRAAEIYSDAGNRLRNAAEWDKEDRQYKTDMDTKQKAIDSARQELTDMQEQARKAGVAEKDKDNDSASSKDDKAKDSSADNGNNNK